MISLGLVLACALGIWTGISRYRSAHILDAPLPSAGGDACAIWFIGSSTIQRWSELGRDMAPWETVNRGVGGATYKQINQRFSHNGAALRPRGIVLYAGENDIAAGASAAGTFEGLKEFLSVKDRLFGERTPVFVVALKPSPKRWSNRSEQLQFNRAAMTLADARLDLDYVEIGPKLLTNGRPGDHYVADGIHLTPEGYRLVAPTIRKALTERLGNPACISRPRAS